MKHSYLLVSLLLVPCVVFAQGYYSGVNTNSSSLLRTSLHNLIKDFDITDVRSVADVPDPVVRFAIQDWLTDKLGLPADSSSVNRVLQIVRGEIKGTEIPAGFRVDRSQGKVRFSVNTKISQESD